MKRLPVSHSRKLLINFHSRTVLINFILLFMLADMTLPALAHVGSPDVAMEGMAGP